jgi:hypothetical protein
VIVLWLAIAAGPTLWVVHLVGASALVEWACESERREWTIHALTVLTALPVLAAVAWCLRAAGTAPAPEEDGTVAGRTRFLALFGALTAAISLALILFEGSYALFIPPCD